MKQAVVFLAFSNQTDDHLPLLDEERKVISEHLRPLAIDNYIQLIAEPTATTTDLSRIITDTKEGLCIFHYGGHSDSTSIFLTDQAANAQGVAQLLALQPNLKLVFLNGCSNREQVGLLQELGVPAVIATSVPISDRKARIFADVFYKALTSEQTLEKAFQTAAANHNMVSGENINITRGLKIRRDDPAVLPWGFYVTEGHEAILNWKIPRQSASQVIVRGAGFRYGANTIVNQKLVLTVANAIAPYSALIQGMLNEAKAKNREPRMRDLRVAVIDSFPIPIGMHLRKLLVAEEISTDRLQKIVNLYQVSAQFLAYVLLAQLWDEKYSNPGLQISVDSKEKIRTFLQLPASEVGNYSFVRLIQSIGDSLAAAGITPFVSEFAALKAAFEAEEEFKQAILFLEEMKVELAGKVAADEIESFCVQGEDKLCILFKHIGFSANYTLATIKLIELLKARHANPKYRHNLVILNQLTAAIGVLDDTIVSNDFSDHNSVILMRDEETVNPSLNLSPFLLDENALSGQQNSKLFYFAGMKDRKLQFTLIDNLKDSLVVEESNYGDVLTAFDGFVNLIK